jgi:DNA-binding CsgD family transcriptional regulator
MNPMNGESHFSITLRTQPRTVTFHLERIVEKLGASNKSQAIFWVLKQGWYGSISMLR